MLKMSVGIVWKVKCTRSFSEFCRSVEAVRKTTLFLRRNVSLYGRCGMAKRLKNMKMYDFTLLGHDCLYGGYPAPVIPIGRKDSALVAVYPGGKAGPTVERLDGRRAYVRYGAKLRKKLASFDPSTDRLFAYSDTEVDRYTADKEEGILRDIVTGRSFPPPSEQF
jgi:hypothetical protein